MGPEKQNGAKIDMDGAQLRAFIESIIDAKNLHATPEVREQLIEDMMQRALDMIDREVLAAVPDDKMDELNRLLDSGASDQDVQQYIASVVPDASRIAAKTLLRFKDAYLG